MIGNFTHTFLPRCELFIRQYALFGSQENNLEQIEPSHDGASEEQVFFLGERLEVPSHDHAKDIRIGQHCPQIVLQRNQFILALNDSNVVVAFEFVSDK